MGTDSARSDPTHAHGRRTRRWRDTPLAFPARVERVSQSQMAENVKQPTVPIMEVYTRQKALIQQAKANPKQVLISDAPAADGASKDMLLRANEVFVNEEWEDSERRLRHIVQEAKFGPIQNKGRLALSLAHLERFDEAKTLATETYTAFPAEPSSYEALARCSNASNEILTALVWAKLATESSDVPSLSLQELVRSLSRQAATLQGQLASTKHLIMKPSIIDLLRQEHCFGIAITTEMEELGSTLAKVHATPENLPQYAEQSVGLRKVMRVLESDSTAIFPVSYTPEHTEFKQPASPLHTLTRGLFLKILKNLNLVFVARLRKTCKLFSLWANHPLYWEAIFTHYCDPIPEIEWGIPRQPFFWSHAVKSLRAQMAGLGVLANLMAADNELTAKMADELYVVSQHFNTYESDLKSGGASSIFDQISALLLAGGPKTANFWISSTRLLPVLPWFLVNGNDSQRSLKDSKSAIRLVTILLMKSAASATHFFKTLRINLPVACIAPSSSTNFVERSNLAAILFSIANKTLHPHSSPLLPHLSVVADVLPEHQHHFYSHINETILHSYIYLTKYPDQENHAEAGILKFKQEIGSSDFTVHGADSLGRIDNIHGAHTLVSGRIEFSRQVGAHQLRFIGTSNPYGFGGAIFDGTESESISSQALGVWTWYRLSPANAHESSSDTEEGFEKMVSEFALKSTSETVNKLDMVINATQSQESTFLSRLRQLFALEVELKNPTISRVRIEQIHDSDLLKDSEVDIDLTMSDSELLDNTVLRRFRVESDFKYARRKDIHGRLMLKINYWRLKICDLHREELLQSASEIETGLSDANSSVGDTMVQTWSKRLVVYYSTTIAALLRNAHSILSKKMVERSAEKFVEGLPGELAKKAAQEAADAEKSKIEEEERQMLHKQAEEVEKLSRIEAENLKAKKLKEEALKRKEEDRKAAEKARIEEEEKAKVLKAAEEEARRLEEEELRLKMEKEAEELKRREEQEKEAEKAHMLQKEEEQRRIEEEVEAMRRKREQEEKERMAKEKEAQELLALQMKQQVEENERRLAQEKEEAERIESLRKQAAIEAKEREKDAADQAAREAREKAEAEMNARLQREALAVKEAARKSSEKAETEKKLTPSETGSDRSNYGLWILGIVVIGAVAYVSWRSRTKISVRIPK